MGRETIDWGPIRTAYVTSIKSYKQIAEEFGITHAAILKKGREDGWVEQRRSFREKAAEKAIKGEINTEAKRLSKIIHAANKMADVIDGIFTDPEQFHRHIVTDTEIDEDGGKTILTVERVFDKVDTRAVKDLTGALKDMTLVLRNLFNLPTQAEAEAQRIAAERLEMDKRKLDAENSTDKTIRVVWDDGLEELAK